MFARAEYVNPKHQESGVEKDIMSYIKTFMCLWGVFMRNRTEIEMLRTISNHNCFENKTVLGTTASVTF